MGEWFTRLNGVEYFFLACAFIGAIFVVIRIILMLSGFGDGADTDMDVAGHDADMHHADSDVGFKILSIQGLSSFLLMFGLVGLALYHESGMGILISMAGATAAGLAAVWVIGKLFSMFVRLQASGTITMKDAVGKEGKVYLSIPENGTGRAMITVGGSLREFDAISAGGERLETGIPIKVVRVDGNTVVVQRAGQ
jgi:membrane protein implicated in regulation of membrane protease activity